MSDGALDSMIGIIPLAIVGGMAMKFTDYAFGDRYPRRRRQTLMARRPPRRMRRVSYQQARRSRLTRFGDFSNVGF